MRKQGSMKGEGHIIFHGIRLEIFAVDLYIAFCIGFACGILQGN